jgi:SH3-like domain-containing protein
MASRQLANWPALVAGLLLCGASWAADFRSIGERPAVLFDAPAAKATRVHVLGAMQPVEVVVKLDKWSKVRDFSGELAWVDNSFLTEKRLVVVSTASAEARSQARATAPMSFEAKRGVVLELAGAPIDGFAPVRHRDGATGYVAISQLWGL